MPKSAPLINPNSTRLSDSSGLERLIFFSDAVFAIAITLLVLDIRLPEGASREFSYTNFELLSQLLGIWPKYLAYGVSFLVVGLFWMNHHRKFRVLTAYDRRLMMLNLLLLMTVAFLPFPTTVLSAYANSTGVIFYASCVTLAGLLSTAMWIYAYRYNLVDARITHGQRRRETWRGLAVPLVFLLSTPIALFNPDYAMYSWLLLIPALWLLR